MFHVINKFPMSTPDIQWQTLQFPFDKLWCTEWFCKFQGKCSL